MALEVCWLDEACPSLLNVTNTTNRHEYDQSAPCRRAQQTHQSTLTSPAQAPTYEARGSHAETEACAGKAAASAPVMAAPYTARCWTRGSRCYSRFTNVSSALWDRCATDGWRGKRTTNGSAVSKVRDRSVRLLTLAESSGTLNLQASR